MSATDATEAILIALAELREEVAALRTELRAVLRQQQAPSALLAALEDYFGPSRFTAASLLKIADEQPHCAIAEALGDLIDMNASARRRPIQLGARLKQMAEIENVAKSHGTWVYRLRVDSSTHSPHPPSEPSRVD
jgi:hypothetical protein